MFKVVPDQLRVSNGWVRCGQCSEVFDANANFQTKTAEEVLNRVAPPNAKPSAMATTPSAHGEAPDVADSLALKAASPEAPIVDADPRVPHSAPQEMPAQLGVSAAPSEDSNRIEEPPLAPADASLPLPENLPPHTFMQVSSAPTRKSARWVRVTWSVLCLLLVLVLLLQFVVMERDRIAATEPRAKRFLEPLCALVACRISPFRQIESVVIDQSSFVKVRSDVFRLNFTLKNTAQVALATPAVELTLTDMQDQALVRRVFLAEDFGGKQGVIDAGAELLASMPLAVKLVGNTEKVSGYRLLSFYP